MLDWWSGQVASDATSLDTGTKECYAPGRELEYASHRRLNVEGSYKETYSIRRADYTHISLAEYAATQPQGYTLPTSVYWIGGSPAKFLQGHNLFGPPVAQADLVVMDVMRNLPLEFRPDIIQGGLHATRIDSTVMIDMGSHDIVHEWLEHAGKHTRTRHGRPQIEGTTVIWGAKSRYEIVAYCKFCELQKHPPSLLDFRDLANDWTRTMLRLELRLYSKELATLALAHAPITEELNWSYLDRVEIGIMKTDGIPGINNLPHVSRLILQSWLGGNPVRNEMKKSQFYTHRRRIHEQTGLDISLAPEGVLDRYPRENLDREWLKAREAKQLPEVFNKWLWRPHEPTDQNIGAN